MSLGSCTPSKRLLTTRFLIGLISEGETPEEAAIRELEEETGFKASGVIQSSPLLVCDPGDATTLRLRRTSSDTCLSGMTNANMKLITVDVPFPEKLEMPVQKLDPGEFITARIVELSKLRAEFQGSSFVQHACVLLTAVVVLTEYEKKVGYPFIHCMRHS